jgi:hypothetical protein
VKNVLKIFKPALGIGVRGEVQEQWRASKRLKGFCKRKRN